MVDAKKYIRYSLFCIALVVAFVISTLHASALTNSSLTLSDPRPSQTGVTYTFDASGYTTGTTIRCIDVVLNTASDAGGSAAATTTSFALGGASTVITPGSWTADATTNGTLRITNAGGETPSASGTLVFSNITNDGTAGQNYYGILTSYTDASCTGGNEVDQVTVAFTLIDGALVQLTIDPTLIFTVSSVGASQSVNGATTTIASTPTGINFQNSVSAVANGISAHDLNVTTNATNGYTVYIRHTGQLSNGSDTIANHTGTNAAPTSFSSAGTEAWGYTTEDSALGGGTADRFTNPGDAWAGFTTSNDPVMDNTVAATSTETVRVGQQVGVAGTTPAGTYQTTIVYTVASVY